MFLFLFLGTNEPLSSGTIVKFTTDGSTLLIKVSNLQQKLKNLKINEK